MRLSHNLRFVFFSNPKCGSESMRALLDPYSEPRVTLDQNPPGRLHPHIRPVDLLREMPTVETYFKFTFVRNPWARLVSLYEFQRRKHDPTDRVPTNFETWLAEVRPDGRGGGAPHLAWKHGSYSLAAFAGDGTRLLVDAVVRLERAEELPPILERIGLPRLELPRLNVGTHGYQSYYNDATRELVRWMYRDDIERFGYAF